MTTRNLTYVDLFAGIGGFRYGIEAFQRAHPELEFKCIKTVDIKSDAVATYNLNFGETNPTCDIRTVGNLPKFDILCAGFPCQPFSSAGKKQGLNDTRGRGDLVFEVARICRESEPTYIILENVSNIETIDGGRTLKRIVDEFSEIGYHISVWNINSLDVGLAQDRSRVFIVGCRTHLPELTPFKPRGRQTISDIVDLTDTSTNISDTFVKSLMARNPKDLYGMSIKDKRGGVNNLHSWDIDYHGPTTPTQKSLMNALLKERRKKKWAGLKGIVWMDGMPLTMDEIRTFWESPTLEDDIHSLESQGYLVLEHPKDVIDGKRQYNTTCPKGYNICKGKLSFPISKILDPAGFSPTLTATDSCKLAVHVGSTIRRLNQLELIRLCGFPESMRLPPGIDMYDVFGNMVCPPVVTAILERILG